MRDERDREAEELRDLGRVLVRADRVRRDVLEHGGGVRAGLQRAAGAGDARLRRRRRRRRDRRCRRSAPTRAARRSRSSRGWRSAGRSAAELGQRVPPVSLLPGWRTRTTPRRRRVVEPVRAGQVDDDCLGGRLERRRLLVVEARRRARRRRRAPRRSARTPEVPLPFRPSRGSSAPAGSPASESEPSATSSSQGARARDRASPGPRNRWRRGLQS